jgi:hypothetical protein
MEGLAIIEGKELKHLKERLLNIEQNQLAILKKLEGLFPVPKQSSVPEYISIDNAKKKYHVSHVTINSKLRLFEKVYQRKIDRLRSGPYFLINELELQQALRLKAEIPALFRTK